MSSAEATSQVRHSWLDEPDVSAIVTEDDAPVDNIPSEKQQRLLTEPLYSSWSGPPAGEGGKERPFLAAANVGMFASPKEPAIVPDVLLSLDVVLQKDWWEKKNRSYFVWEMGKAPEVVIELVSNREGDELVGKRRRYARMGVAHYVVWDAARELGGPELRVFELREGVYVSMERAWFEEVGLGLVAWEGVYEGRHDRWLRWCDIDGVVPTGAERAEEERVRAERERVRAERERVRAERERARAERERARAERERVRAEREQVRAASEYARAEREQVRAASEHARAERLAEQLRALGIDPDEGG